jgi:hypothetical protein
VSPRVSDVRLWVRENPRPQGRTVQSRRLWESRPAGGHVRKGDEGRGRHPGHAGQYHGAQLDAGIRAKEMAPNLGGDAAEVETD